MSDPYSNALAASLTPLKEAARTSVLTTCSLYSFTISLTRHRPPNELSSTLPTKGDTYLAPDLADKID